MRPLLELRGSKPGTRALERSKGRSLRPGGRPTGHPRTERPRASARDESDSGCCGHGRHRPARGFDVNGGTTVQLARAACVSFPGRGIFRTSRSARPSGRYALDACAPRRDGSQHSGDRGRYLRPARGGRRGGSRHALGRRTAMLSRSPRCPPTALSSRRAVDGTGATASRSCSRFVRESRARSQPCGEQFADVVLIGRQVVVGALRVRCAAHQEVRKDLPAASSERRN